MRRILLTEEHLVKDNIVKPRRIKAPKSQEERLVSLVKYHQRKAREYKEQLNAARGTKAIV